MTTHLNSFLLLNSRRKEFRNKKLTTMSFGTDNYQKAFAAQILLNEITTAISADANQMKNILHASTNAIVNDCDTIDYSTATGHVLIIPDKKDQPQNCVFIKPLNGNEYKTATTLTLQDGHGAGQIIGTTDNITTNTPFGQLGAFVTFTTPQHVLVLPSVKATIISQMFSTHKKEGTDHSSLAEAFNAAKPISLKKSTDHENAIRVSIFLSPKQFNNIFAINSDDDTTPLPIHRFSMDSAVLYAQKQFQSLPQFPSLSKEQIENLLTLNFSTNGFSLTHLLNKSATLTIQLVHQSIFTLSSAYEILQYPITNSIFSILNNISSISHIENSDGQRLIRLFNQCFNEFISSLTLKPLGIVSISDRLSQSTSLSSMRPRLLEEKLEHVTISATTKRPYEHQTANTTQQQQQYQRQGYSNGGRGYSNGGRGNNNRNNNGGRGTEDPRWKAWRDKKKPEWQGKMICRNMIWFGKCEGPCSQTLHRFPPNTSQSIRSAIEQHIREMPHAANPYKH